MQLWYWHQRADESLAALPRVTSTLVLKDKVRRSPGKLRVSRSMERGNFSLWCFDTVCLVTRMTSGL